MLGVCAIMPASEKPASADQKPEIDARAFPYMDGDVQCIGYFAAPRMQMMAMDAYPVAVIFPEWWGMTDHTKSVAEEFARQGYYALVADMYGNGVVVDTPAEAQALATPWYEDRAAMARQAQAAIDAVSKFGGADRRRVGAIGFCFGGTIALELARQQVPIRAAVECSRWFAVAKCCGEGCRANVGVARRR